MIDRKSDEIDAAREKRLNRRSLNLDSRTDKGTAPDRPQGTPEKTNRSVTVSPKSKPRPKSYAGEATSPPTSPTPPTSTKKSRAPPPPCSAGKDSRIPVPSGAGNPERPPRRKKSSSGEEPASPGATGADSPKTPPVDVQNNLENPNTPPQSSQTEEVFVSSVVPNDSCFPAVSLDIVAEEATSKSTPSDLDPVSRADINVIEPSKPSEDTVNSNYQEEIFVNHTDVKLIEILPEVAEEEDRETDAKVVTFSKRHTEIPNPDTVSLCSIDSIPPDLPNSAPPPLLPKQPDTASIGEEAVVVAQEVQAREKSPPPATIEEEIKKPGENSEQDTAESSSFSDPNSKISVIESADPVKMSVEAEGKPEEINKVTINVDKDFEVDSDADSDLSDILNQNDSFTPGKSKSLDGFFKKE